MSEEKYVELKKAGKARKRKSFTPQNERFCIIHLNQNKTDHEIRPLTEHSFSKIKEVADIWKKCDNQDDNFEEIISQLPSVSIYPWKSSMVLQKFHKCFTFENTNF